MKPINTIEIINSCDTVARRCIEIAGTRHGGAWLFDKLMRTFSFDAVESVTFEVYINAPVMRKGTATIGRDGSLVMRTI